MLLAPDATRMCQHCGKRVASRGRGLCWSCYEKTDIRSRYSCRKGYYPRQPAEGNDDFPIEPTEHMPGTAEKIEVLRQRAEAMAPLHHPQDAGQEESFSQAGFGRGACRPHVRVSFRGSYYSNFHLREEQNYDVPES